MVSLYAWHGCIHMGKVLRCTYNTPEGQALYTPPMRREGYEHVKADWMREEARGNPWIRYGVSLTRLMEQGRKKENFDFEVHENWIPDESPYWEEVTLNGGRDDPVSPNVVQVGGQDPR